MTIPINKILQDLQDIVTESTERYNKSLNIDTYVIDLGINALRKNDPKLQQEDYAKLLSTLYKTYPTQQDLKIAVASIKDPSSKLKVVLVDDSSYGLFLVSKDYRLLQAAIGTISASMSDNMIVASNVTYKVTELLKRLPLSASSSIVRELNKLNESYSTEIICDITLNNFNNSVAIQKILGKASVLISIDNKYRTTEFVNAEKTILNKVVEYINSNEFKDLVLEDAVSDIISTVASTIGSKTYSKPEQKAKSRSTKKNSSDSNIVLVKAKQLRTKTGQFYSNALLLELLNKLLPETIRKHMGKGSAKSILNNRTGRFSESASVSKLTQDRDGSIVAYYDYMKYPYQTFEPGFAQGSPKTRDPKLLIAKSIREIAATKVANRMKAILI